MQRAEDSSSRLDPEPPPSRPSFSSPGLAFAVITILALVTGSLLYVSRPDPVPTPVQPIATDDNPDFSLTDEEAIVEFEELHRRELLAYRRADISLLASLFTHDSPIARKVLREVRQLARDDVYARPRYETKKLSVVRNGPTEVTLRQIAHVSSSFIDAQGTDVGNQVPTQKQVIRWTIALEGDSWRLHDAVITFSEIVK